MVCIQLCKDIDGETGPCVENHPSIYSSVAFHLKKATGHGHFHCVGRVSSYVLKDLRVLVLSGRISPCLPNFALFTSDFLTLVKRI